MNNLFTKPLDVAFFTGLAIIILQFTSKRIKPNTKAIINETLKNIQTKLKSIRLNNLFEGMYKPNALMPAILLNAIILGCLFFKIYQHEMNLEGKDVPELTYEDVSFTGCLVILLFILGKTMHSLKQREIGSVAVKLARVLVPLLFITILCFIAIAMFDTLSKYQEPKALPWKILQSIMSIISLLIFSGLSLFLFLQILIVPFLYLLRKLFLFVFPTQGDTLEIALTTVVAILGIIKIITGYI